MSNAGPVVTLFNAKYSPNLGDGLLSECLEWAIDNTGAQAAGKSVDLAGRTNYGEFLTGRKHVMTALSALPKGVREAVLRVPLSVLAETKWRAHYAQGLNGSTLAIVGGGNLIIDIDLNFPTKLGVAMAECSKRRIPVALYGVGVGGEMSRIGKSMFERMFGSVDLRAVFVRDEASKRSWDRHFGEVLKTAEIVRDPGLLASEVYARGNRMRERQTIGICLMSPIAITYHTHERFDPKRLDDWFVALGSWLVQHGYRLSVFTNGAPEDREYLQAMKPRMLAEIGVDHLEFLDQSTPAELCGHISNMKAIVAYRMHAIIAAYSFGVPFLALSWDRKLASFVQSVGMSANLVDAMKTAPPAAGETLISCLEQGISDQERTQVIREAKSGVDRLLRAVA